MRIVETEPKVKGIIGGGVTNNIVALEKEKEKRIQEAEKQRKAEDEKHQEEYANQLKSFKEDNSQLEKYKNILIERPKDVLIRLFTFKPEGGKKSTILQQDSQGNWSKEVDSVKAITSNIAKVLTAEESSGYKAGDLVLLKYSDTLGMLKNPQWEHYEVSLRAQGVDAIPPEDVRKYIPAIEQSFSRYKFKWPGNYVMDQDDRITFCLPSLEIVGKI